MTDKPQDHPPVSAGKIGVLIGNLGTPDATDYWSVRRYLSEFLMDKRVVDVPRWKWIPILQLVILSFRPFISGKAYASIWNNEKNESPLLTITRDQSKVLSAALKKQYGDNVVVEFCMRYGNPSTKSGVQSLIDQGCTKILFMPLYPQYSAATIGTANDHVFRALMDIRHQPALRTVDPYYAHPKHIVALGKSIKKAYAAMKVKPDVLVASYHGLPQRFLTEGDPYHCHCLKTTRLVREYLGWSDTDIVSTFQSRFGVEDWLQPYTVEEVARLAKAGKTNMAVFAPAFSADCIETLEEINEEIKEAFIHAGGKSFTYIPCLNADADHIDMMVEIVGENIGGWT